MITIRDEAPGDRVFIRELIIAAFGQTEWGYNGEADLVDQLHQAGDERLSLVAVSEGHIVGHAMFSAVELSPPALSIAGMGLGPMAVAPNNQRSGIGRRLIEVGIEQLRERGKSFVVVLGHPDYYPQSRFEPAGAVGLRHGFEDIPQDVFFVRVLDQHVVPLLRGRTVLYREEFGRQVGNEPAAR